LHKYESTGSLNEVARLAISVSNTDNVLDMVNLRASRKINPESSHIKADAQPDLRFTGAKHLKRHATLGTA
jgi:hypothetical protein